MLNVFVLLNILFALLAFGIYLFSNVAIRRYVAGIRSREDYESDVDGTMTKEEKKKEKEQKVIEAEKVKIGFRETYREYPARCIVLAILGAILTGINFWYFGITVQAGLYSLFFLFLLMIALIDFDTMEIPPSLNLAILILGIPGIFTMPSLGISIKEQLISRLIGAVCIALPMLLIDLIKSGAFGGGDIKLLVAAGFFLGWKANVAGFFTGAIIGAVVSISLMARKKKGGKEHIPFGPSLCVGLILASYFGKQLINWYIGVLQASMSQNYY